jgi:hypothetical protein
MKIKFIKNEYDLVINTLESLIAKKDLLIREVSEKARKLTIEFITEKTNHIYDPKELLEWANSQYNMRGRDNTFIETIEAYNNFTSDNIEIKKQSLIHKKTYTQASETLNTENTKNTLISGLKSYFNKKINNTITLNEFENYSKELTKKFLTKVLNKDHLLKLNYIIKIKTFINNAGINKGILKNIESIESYYFNKSYENYHSCSFEYNPIDQIIEKFHKCNIKNNSDYSILYCTQYQKNRIYYNIHASNLYSSPNRNFITQEIEDLYNKRRVLRKENRLLNECKLNIEKTLNSKFEGKTEGWRPIYLEERVANEFTTIPEKFNFTDIRIDHFSLSFFHSFNIALMLATKNSGYADQLEEEYSIQKYHKILVDFIKSIDELLIEENPLYEIYEVIPVCKTLLNLFDFLDENIINTLKSQELKKILSFNFKLNNF